MSRARLVLAALACVTLAACATANVKPPQPPDNSILARAEAMTDKAAAAGAAKFAPDALSAARRRLTVARMILYRKAGSSIGEAERERLQRLAESAYLDARLALVRTQAGAVEYQRKQLAGDLPDNNGAARKGDTP